jgi:hypothetical protein
LRGVHRKQRECLYQSGTAGARRPVLCAAVRDRRIADPRCANQSACVMPVVQVVGDQGPVRRPPRSPHARRPPGVQRGDQVDVGQPARTEHQIVVVDVELVWSHGSSPLSRVNSRRRGRHRASAAGRGRAGAFVGATPRARSRSLAAYRAVLAWARPTTTVMPSRASSSCTRSTNTLGL